MRFLLISTPSHPLAPSVAPALQRHEHTPVTPEELGLDPAVGGRDLFIAAQSKQVEILTADPDIANAPFEEGANLRYTHALVFLQMPVEGQGEEEHDDAIDRLFTRYKRLTPGRLYTLTETRVKVRQLPGL